MKAVARDRVLAVTGTISDPGHHPPTLSLVVSANASWEKRSNWYARRINFVSHIEHRA
jgi:hypothetical protein